MTINEYGDKLIQAGRGHGADISMQRPDDLDLLSISECAALYEQGTKPVILDLGSGRGAQCIRLLNAGADIGIACDLTDFSEEFEKIPVQNRKGQNAKRKFLTTSFASEKLTNDLMQLTNNVKFDIIVFQRAIHYLNYKEAQSCLAQVSQLLSTNGKLYLSASGLNSELAENYKGTTDPIYNRFDFLSEKMKNKHGIYNPVCLYKSDELINLCQDLGFNVIKAFESTFGNIKIVAQMKNHTYK
jgi:SAM-dependent methyltransferase